MLYNVTDLFLTRKQYGELVCKFLVTLYMKALLVIVEYHFNKLFFKLRVSRCQERIKIKHYLTLFRRVCVLSAAYNKFWVNMSVYSITAVLLSVKYLVFVMHMN